MNDRNNLIISVSIFAVALILCAVIVTATWRSNNSASQTITVTGSAKKEIVSDLGILRGSIAELLRQKPLLASYLKSQGFPEDKIEFLTVNSYAVYEMGANGYQTQNVIGYVYNQRMEVVSNDVNKIKAVSLDIPSLIEKGVNFNVEMPEYHYTKLAELKIEIQAAAAKDAMTRARKIADATDRDLGPMRSARMGILQITPKLSNQISDYGINDLSSIEKEITAVVNASFEIE
jgi:hypothetical protein